jgi:hypothetical protein
MPEIPLMLYDEYKNRPNPLQEAIPALMSLIKTQTEKPRKEQFMQGVQAISQSQEAPDVKINKLIELTAQHGTDYGFGVKDIFEQYQSQASRGRGVFEQSDGKTVVPEGFEVVGYDQKGNPMIRKVAGISVGEKKFAVEQEEKKKALEIKAQMVKDSALDTINTIGEVEKGIKHFGLLGKAPSVPGTERANWEANVNKLLSSKIINLMTSMKEASKTGATGFGQLSEKELKVLQDASTALNRGLSPKDAGKYLEQMKVMANKVLGNQTQDTRSQYNALRSQGLSAEQARKQLGL